MFKNLQKTIKHYCMSQIYIALNVFLSKNLMHAYLTPNFDKIFDNVK